MAIYSLVHYHESEFKRKYFGSGAILIVLKGVFWLNSYIMIKETHFGQITI